MLSKNEKQSVSDCRKSIGDQTQDFTGRLEVFEAVHDWLARPQEGRFFILTGEPGSGKTAIAGRLCQFSQGLLPPDGLTNLTCGFVSAVHFCSVRDALSIDPLTFAGALATQLANRYPAYLETLEHHGEDRPVRIEVTQNVQMAVQSSVVGVIVHVSGPSSESMFNRVVREPLEALFRDGAHEPVIILVDALDEALAHSVKPNISDLLAKTENLPAGVRFIVTCRPEVEVLRSLKRFAFIEYSLSSDVGLRRSETDVEQHVRGTLKAWPKLAAKLAGDLAPAAFARAVGQKSAGNFLYMRYLLDMLVGQRGKITNKSLERWPAGLDGIYLEFLERLLKNKERSWKEYEPVLGSLAVAQSTLTEAQLANIAGLADSEVRRVLVSLRQLLAVDERLTPSQRAYALYHRSFADFLLDAERSEEYWCEAVRMHRRIADYYWDAFQGDWCRCDTYGLDALAMHLFAISDTKRLMSLVSRHWMRARYENSGYTYGGFLGDIDLAWQAGLSDERKHLTNLVRIQAVRQVVAQRVSMYTSADLGALFAVGREAEALQYTQLQNDPKDRLEGLLAIYRVLSDEGQSDPRVLDEAYTVARSIRDPEAQVAALCRLAPALSEMDDRSVAELLTLAEQAARTVSDEMARTAALCAVGLLLYRSHPRRAAAVLREAEELALAIGRDPGGALSLREVGEAWIEVHNYARAEAVIHSIHDEHRSEALAKLAVALVRGGRIRKAVRIGRGLPTAQTWFSGRGALAVALAEAGCHRDAEEMVGSITNRYERVGAMRQLGLLFASAGDEHTVRARSAFAEAETLAQSIEDPERQATELQQLAVALFQAGHPHAERTSRIFKDAETGVLSIEDDERRSMMLYHLTSALAETRRQTEALDLAHSIDPIKGRWRVMALLAVGRSLTQSGGNGPEACLEEAEEAARLISDVTDRVSAMRNLAVTLFHCAPDKVDWARRIIAAAAQQARASNKVQWQVWQTEEDPHLALILAQFADAGEAAEIVHRLRETIHGGAAECDLAGALANAGYYEAADLLASTIQIDEKRAIALCELARALNSDRRQPADRRDGAFAKAEMFIISIADAGERASGWCRLAESLASSHDSGRVDRAFAEARKAIQSVDGQEQRAKLQHELVAALARTGRCDDAEKVAGEVEDSWLRQSAFRELVRGLAIGGACDKAEERAYATSRYWHACSLADVIACWTRAHNPRASTLFARATELAGSIAHVHLYYVSALRELISALAQAESEYAGDIVPMLKEAKVRTHSEVWPAEALVELAVALAESECYSDAAEVESQILVQRQRETARLGIADALARGGRLGEALAQLGTCPIHEFVQKIVRWRPSFERVAPGLSLLVLREALEILGWIHPRWLTLHATFSARGDGAEGSGQS